jgi:acyl-CoA synthetase (AMP-forming)/AMP-acid ligase II
MVRILNRGRSTCWRGEPAATGEADHCRARIAHYKRPRSVRISLEPLPLSGPNKIDKVALRSKYWAGKYWAGKIRQLN